MNKRIPARSARNGLIVEAPVDAIGCGNLCATVVIASEPPLQLRLTFQTAQNTEAPVAVFTHPIPEQGSLISTNFTAEQVIIDQRFDPGIAAPSLQIEVWSVAYRDALGDEEFDALVGKEMVLLNESGAEVYRTVISTAISGFAVISQIAQPPASVIEPGETYTLVIPAEQISYG